MRNIDKESTGDSAPLFSIVVLTYQQMHLLRDCLKSIFRQSYPNIELVICDDCSADFDEESVRSYIDKHKRKNLKNTVIYRHDRNVGTSANANKAISLSSGTYFKLHAGDDMLYGRDVLKHVSKQLEKDDVSLVACRSVACTYNGTMTDDYYPSYGAVCSMMDADAKRQFELISTQSWGEFINAPAVFWKRDFFDHIGGFDLNYKYTEDWPMWLKITSMGYRITPVNMVTTIYRYGGISNDASSLNLVLGNDHYNECIRMLKEMALPYLQADAGFMKTFRCKHCIWCIEARIVAETHWEHWNLLQQLVWRIKNLGALIISWAYRKKKYGIAFHPQKQFIATLFFILMYQLNVVIWPNTSCGYLWTAGFMVSCAWLLGKIILVCMVKLMNQAINLLKG